MKRGMCRPLLASLGLVVSLAGCGGGGGGGSSPGNGPLPSLVPAPGPLGAVLYADATVLRPLAAGSTWTYRGFDTASVGATPTVYTDTVTQTTSGSGVAETNSNAFNQGSSPASTEYIQGGSVMSSATVQLTPNTAPMQLTAPELRSPVQQNDQYTVLEQHLADSGTDVDGDGKDDAADIAIYWVVQGVEDLALDSLPTVHAVRVDLFLAVRYTLSSTGATTPTVVASTQSTWYAPGVGIVKQTQTTPTSPTDNQVVTEIITSWDAGTTGFGAMATSPVTIPASNGDLPDTQLPAAPFGTWAAIAQTDHALVFSAVGLAPATQSVVSRLDLRGNVTEAHIASGVDFAQPYLAVVGDTAGAMMLAPDQNLSAGLVFATLFDTHGNLTGTATLDLGGGRFLPNITRIRGAADDAVVWLVYTRQWTNVGVASVQDLVVGQFNSQGQPVAPEVILDSTTNQNAVFNPQIHAANGQVAVTWAHPDGLGADALVAVGATASNTFSTETMATLVPGEQPYVTPLVTSAGTTLLWDSPLVAGDTLNGSAGVLLGPGNVPIRATSGSIDTETLGQIPIYSPAPTLSGAGTIVFGGTAYAPLYSETTNPAGPLDLVSWLTSVSGSALSTEPASTVAFANMDAPSFSLAFPDRVIVLSGGGALNSTVVWLNAGGR